MTKKYIKKEILKKCMSREALLLILGIKPEKPLRGENCSRKKFNIREQILAGGAAYYFYYNLPYFHKNIIMSNANSKYKVISGEAYILWSLFEKYECDPLIDYKTLFDFKLI